ncbi:MAG: class I SAM-dependent methyltransferase [Anaerolineae bacterium]|nr:class I SAM-dependent methyltransferase [Anaerolineae bacterium]
MTTQIPNTQNPPTMESPNFFRDNSPFLRHPLLTTDRTAREIDFLTPRLTIMPPARVLDIGCGFGRHSIELARRGFTGVGIDPSQAMITAARQRAAEAGVTAKFQQAAAEHFQDDHPFDAAICLFTTLGQISEGGDNLGLLGNVFTLLRPGARLAIETPQRDATVRNMKPFERFEGPNNAAEVTRSFDPASSVLTEVFEVGAGAATERYVLRYRLFDAAQLAGLLLDAGFRQAEFTDGYTDSPLHDDSPAMLVVAQRP